MATWSPYLSEPTYAQQNRAVAEGEAGLVVRLGAASVNHLSGGSRQQKPRLVGLFPAS